MAALHAFLTADFLGTATWLWLAFLTIVLALLIFDLGVLHRDQHEIEMRESLLLYGGYFSVGVLFGVWVWFELLAQGAGPAGQGGGFGSHAGWRVRSTGWRARSGAMAAGAAQ